MGEKNDIMRRFWKKEPKQGKRLWVKNAMAIFIVIEPVQKGTLQGFQPDAIQQPMDLGLSIFTTSETPMIPLPFERLEVLEKPWDKK